MRQSAWMIRPAVVMMLSLLAIPDSAGQSLADLHPGVWGGSLEIGYGTDRQELRSGDGSPPIDSSRRRTVERVTLRNDGFYFLDPGLATGNLSLTLGRLQERASTEDVSTSREATLTGYAFDSTFLGALPYNGTLYANRSENFLTQPFGRTDLTLENHGLALRLREDSQLRNWGVPFFSAALRAEQQHTKEDTTSVLGQSFRRDERRDTVALDARKGFETSDLEMHYETSDLVNSTFPDASFQSQTASLSYSSDFGPLLNRRSDARLFYYNRSGASQFSLLSADERLRIEHQQNLTTTYSYSLARASTPQDISTTQRGAMDVQYRPYRDLLTNAEAAARHQQVSAGTRDAYSGQLGLQYHRALAGSGAAFARAVGRYQIDDNRLGASQINVIDEAQTAPSPLGTGAGFLLNQAFIIPSSIVVVDTRGGARLATTLGVDYDVVIEGDLVRIVPLPTSAVIQPGDPLAVSYAYELDPSIKYGTTSGSVGGGADLRWIAFSFGHEQSEQKLISGHDGRFLQNIRRDSAQLDLRGAWRTFQAQAGAAYVRYDSTRLAYSQQRYTQLLSHRPRRAFALTLQADETSTDFTLPPVHRTDARSLRLTADWYAPSGWATTAFVGRRVFEDTLQPTETIDEGAVRSRFTYGKLDLSGAFTVTRRSRGGSELSSWRIDTLAARRF